MPVDYKQAMEWFCKSAETGFAMARNAIGILYGNGLGVTVDYAEAMRWYRIAAIITMLPHR